MTAEPAAGQQPRDTARPTRRPHPRRASRRRRRVGHRGQPPSRQPPAPARQYPPTQAWRRARNEPWLSSLIKLCVGCDSITDLEDWIAMRLKERRKRGLPREHMHRTRMVPKRTAELLDGGSLYWVIRGELACRQRLLDVRPFVDKAGIRRCHLVLEPKPILVEPRPWRAFQGWRYLEHKDCPRDLDRAAPGARNMPEALRRELRELGLL